MNTAPYRLLSIAALITAGASAPALAAPQSTDSNTNTTATVVAESRDASGGRTARTGSPRQRVCVHNERAGSRIFDEVCRTRAEWESLGGIPTD
jgi:hypothetical protein